MVANTHIIQVNPRPYKLEVITYCLKEKAGFSANIITRLKRNEYVSIESIEKICRVMECGVDDILEFVPEEK